MATLYRGAPFKADRYLFRGQLRYDWPLRASFDRVFPEIPVGQRRSRFDEMLSQFRAACEAEGVSPNVLFTDDLLALGQHYGLPTRLLDWSRSPYVACFFAFADVALSGGLTNVLTQTQEIGKLAPDLDGPTLLEAITTLPGTVPVAIWALERTNPVWSDDYGVQIKNVASVIANVRCRNQGGAFTLLTGSHADLQSWADSLPISAADDTPLLWRFVLPACETLPALADLRAMGIDFTRLYPDLQGCALDSKLEAVCRASGGAPLH